LPIIDIFCKLFSFVKNIQLHWAYCHCRHV
jgi:hypothetical protein